MRQFVLLYCSYDPDNYCGHRIENIAAETETDAKLKAREFLNNHWNRMLFEFRLIEVTSDSGYRIWDTRQPGDRVRWPDETIGHGNTYTNTTYWEK